MSLDEAPAPTLSMMKGKLEAIEEAWNLAAQPAKRRAINEEFKSLADEIKRKYGDEGARAVNEVVAKHKKLSFGRY